MKIELSIHAKNLKNVAGMLKGVSDPYCTVTKVGDDSHTAVLLGTSEVIKNNLSPDWARVFVLHDYDPNNQEVKIAVSIFDRVEKKDDISMGSTIFEVGAVLAARGSTMSKTMGKHGGTVFVHARESRGSGVLRLKLKGKNLKNVEGLFSKSDPFFELSRKIDAAGGQTWDNVYRSDDVHNNLNPDWAPITIEVSVLCGGDLDHPIQLAVFDYESSGKHIPMGSFVTSINEMVTKCKMGQEAFKLKQKGKDVGIIEVEQATVDGVGAVEKEEPRPLAMEQPPIVAPVATAPPSYDDDSGGSFFAMTREFENNKPDALKNDVRMISGCEDHDVSADVSNVSAFGLPDPAGRAGGACTATLLKVLYENEERPDEVVTFVDVLTAVRQELQNKGLKQIPQLTSSNPINVKDDPFELVPEAATGTRRAVLIGINYVGQQGELRGCHNDVKNMNQYIQDFYGFQDGDISVLIDDGQHVAPTKQNIIDAYKKVVAESQPGDAIFLHYSGHGSRVRDTSGDEDDGYDECLCPLDCKSAGMIVDDQLYDILVRNLAQGVHMVALMDCCHSGTVMDLPYIWKADGTMDEGMRLDSSLDLNGLLLKCGGAAVSAFQGLGRGAKALGTGVGKGAMSVGAGLGQGAKKVGTGVKSLVPGVFKPTTAPSPDAAASTGAGPDNSNPGVYIPPATQQVTQPPIGGNAPGAPPTTTYTPSKQQATQANAAPSVPQQTYTPNNYNQYNASSPSAPQTYAPTSTQPPANAYGVPQPNASYATASTQQSSYVPADQYNPYAQTTATTTTTSYGQPYGQQQITGQYTSFGGTNTITTGYVPPDQYNPYAQNAPQGSQGKTGQYNPYDTASAPSTGGQTKQYKPYVTK